jgi:hypothetical protein
MKKAGTRRRTSVESAVRRYAASLVQGSSSRRGDKIVAD